MRPRAFAMAAPVALGLTLLAAGCSKNDAPEMSSGAAGSFGGGPGGAGGGPGGAGGGPGGSTGGGTPDGGVDTSGWLHGVHAFDVTSTIDNAARPTVGIPQRSSNFAKQIPVPPTQTFALVLDADNGIAIFRTQFLRARTTDGQTFVLQGAMTVSDSADHANVEYGELRVNINGETIGGSATASVTSYNDFEQPSSKFNLGLALLSGHSDTTPPTFSIPTTIDPDYQFDLFATEALPTSSVVSLRDLAGNTIVFAPYLVFDGSGNKWSAAAGIFEGPNGLVLDYGTTYTLVRDGLYDFAGNQAAPLSITTTPLPPLVPQDGFESSPAIPGATIVGDGTLPAITGSKSLYLPPHAAGESCARGLVNDLAVRLALPAAGATKVTFAVRAVSTNGGLQYRTGMVHSGKALGRNWSVSPSGPLTMVDLPDGSHGYLSPVSQVSVTLPADATGTVVLTVSGGCPVDDARVGMILDDLRVE